VTNTGLCFAFERSKNSAGVDTTEAVLFTSHSASGASNANALTAVWSTTLGVLGATETTFGCLFPSGATAASGAQTMVMPVFHSKGVFMNPGLNCVGYFTENLTPGSSISVYMYGTAHTYQCLAAIDFAASTSFRGPGSGTESMAIRYE
jgi:hypothetical protein